MSTPSPKLPPTERDFDVYQFVAIETHSTREAAAQFGLSQTRVRQVLEKVVGFMAEAIPVESGLSEEKRLIVGEQAAAMRLDFLYGQAVGAWRTSQGPICTVREGINGEVKTTRPGFGEVRFLGAAARIALLAAKVPWSGAGLCVKEEGVGERGSGVGEKEASPPVGDCSEIAVSRGLGEEVTAASADASALIERLCYERAERKSRLAEVVSAPAQTAEDGELFRDRPFTKKERKARRRRLERLMAG